MSGESVRYPTLTEDGRALLQNARAVADQMDGFKARAKILRVGLPYSQQGHIPLDDIVGG